MDTPSPAASDPVGTIVTFSVSGLPVSSLADGDTLTYEYGGASGTPICSMTIDPSVASSEECNEAVLGAGTYSDIVAVFSGDDNLAAAISSNSTSLTVTGASPGSGSFFGRFPRHFSLARPADHGATPSASAPNTPTSSHFCE